MRLSILTFVILLSMPTAICPSSSEDDLETLVRAALTPKSDAIYEGFMEGPLNRSGDAAAVAITKVVSDKNLSPSEIDRILSVIDMSFASPKIIEIETNRQPRTTLFVLRYLQSLSVSPEVQHKIAETKAHVEQSAKSSAGGKQ